MPIHPNHDEPNPLTTDIHPAEVIHHEAPTAPDILFFDEADTLFSKRSTVEDTHHRNEFRKD